MNSTPPSKKPNPTQRFDDQQTAFAKLDGQPPPLRPSDIKTLKHSPPTPSLAWSLLPPAWQTLDSHSNHRAVRAKQIWNWLYQRHATSWDDMTNLPAPWRDHLSQTLSLNPWQSQEVLQDDDGTQKLILTTPDSALIESVLIPSTDRLTLCVSTQAGCALGCFFCATGQSGLQRNLAAGEIVGQYMAAAALSPRRITNVVLMGMGEPFVNYDSSLDACRILNHYDGISLGARRITISTCGIIPGIQRLAQDPLQVELAVSLHAATDSLRSRLMPINDKYPLSLLLPACRDYTEKTGRIITFEYTLIAGLNDTPSQLTALIQAARSTRARVNLIPLSPVAHFPGQPPSLSHCQSFARQLNSAGINATLRHSRGAAIGAACGQLRPE